MLNSIVWELLDCLNGGEKPYTFWGGGFTVAGLVKTYNDSKGNYPIANVWSEDDCKKGVSLLIPSPDKKGLIFFEHISTDVELRCGMIVSYTSRVRMVFWYNKCKMGFASECTAAFPLFANLLSKLPNKKTIEKPDGVSVKITGVDVEKFEFCNNNAFNKYALQDKCILNNATNETMTVDLKIKYNSCGVELPDFENVEPCNCIC